ncbi:UNVERIFIED_CONTAM: hypothetical protein Slati_0151400 [Sesamum latifolium]|uniref:Uncharacterized protein n=1 Tax=Sesamum latifolium TaxID=2727402 RepID=A0AAW2YA47_9LAMI
MRVKMAADLYWKDDVDLEYYKFCEDARATVEHMVWHATHQTDEGSLRHPSNAEAWRHFDQTYPNFVEEPRNLRLGLCTDGFAMHR